MSEKIKALLATGRISNLPTVWCNCLAAAVILYHYTPLSQSCDYSISENHLYFAGMILLLCTSLLYVGGCFLGDAIDAKFDAEHKPDRPIPAGIISKKTVFISAIVMLLAGLLLPIVFHFLANINSYAIHPKTPNYGWQQMSAVPYLFAVIVLYSLFHKRHALLGLPMIGLCRFFLVIFAASIFSWIFTRYSLSDSMVETAITTPFYITPIIIFASAVALYTICFASVARTESSDSPITWRKALRYTMLGLPLLAVITKDEFYGSYHQPAAITAVAIYALWLIHSFSYLTRNKGIYVSKCLAGFCLLDACFVAQFGWIWLIICLILFACSLALQKIAPAT